MPKNNSIKSILIIGSGPIVIGQACEFDYSGSQASRSLREEGIEVTLINSNPATIMTDKVVADNVYLKPLEPESIVEILQNHKIDAVLPTMGGQTALNLAIKCDEMGIWEEHGVEIIGVDIKAIEITENREEFRLLMNKIGIPMAPQATATSFLEGKKIAQEFGFPLCIRASYTLGGAGASIVHDPQDFDNLLERGLQLSPIHEVMIDKALLGWKEFELELLRDSNDNVVIICSIENFDPMGIHTGDSITVAPAMTLSDTTFQKMRDMAIKMMRSIGNFAGGCNVQFALHPESFEYCVIEVNPRVSRSSALASKATGYPIAKVAAKIALGYTLDEIQNAVTGKTYASFEPALDYVVVKIPKWPFDKFITAKRTLTTQMKATGEVMSICTNFEGALMKALRSLEQNIYSLDYGNYSELDTKEIRKKLHQVDDRRLFVIAEAIRRGVSQEEIHEITKIDLWFLDKIAILVEMEEKLKTKTLDGDLLKEAKRLEYPDSVIGKLTGKSTEEIKRLRHQKNILAAYKMVDTCAAEFEASTPYYYSCFGSENEVAYDGTRKKVMVLGSGPIRIGQGIEFDYCSVHSVWALKECGYETIIVNNNPETVSTDFDIADKLYFEPLTPEDVENIVDLEKPDGAVVQFGGQTAIKLTQALIDMGVPILGTSGEDVDAAEDRERFDAILEECQIPRPAGKTVYTEEEAIKAANELGYPVLVRPSYVLGGQGMQIAISDKDIKEFMGIINQTVQEHPILVDKYLMGKEVEVDAVCDGEDILIPGIMEHIERAGIHSGDSISVYPTQNVSSKMKEVITDYTKKLAKSLHVIGLINIQFIIYEEQVYVIEVNPRSSRTVPYISKVTGIPIVPLATRAILGEKIKDMGYEPGLAPEVEYTAIKMPVFSFEKLRGADISLGPEMKSTGECLGIGKTFNEALYKAFQGAGVNLPKHKKIIFTLKDADKLEAVDTAKRFQALGYKIYATNGTGNVFLENGIDVTKVNKIEETSPTVLDIINHVLAACTAHV